MKLQSYKIRIAPSASLPYKTIRGTEAERFKLAEKLTEDYFQAIKDLFTPENPSVKVRLLTRKAKKILPPSIKVKILPFNKYKKGNENALANCNYLAHESNPDTYEIIKFLIHVPMGKNKKVEVDDVFQLMHEIRHFADYLTSPKFIQTGMTNIINTVQVKGDANLESFFKKEIYNTKKLSILRKIYLNIKMNKVLRKLTDEQKIEGLQHIRNQLKTEMNAYSKMLFYQSVINEQVGIDCALKTDKQYAREFDFERKLKFVNRKLYRCIKSIRNKQLKTKFDS